MWTACSLVRCTMLRWAYLNLFLETCIVQLCLLQLGYALGQLTQVRLICTSQIAAPSARDMCSSCWLIAAPRQGSVRQAPCFQDQKGFARKIAL